MKKATIDAIENEISAKKHLIKTLTNNKNIYQDKLDRTAETLQQVEKELDELYYDLPLEHRTKP